MRRWILGRLRKVRGANNYREYSILKNLKSNNDLVLFQTEQLSNLLLHAYEKVPYYNNIFQKYKIISDGTIDLSNFDNIPFLTKEIIRSNFKDLISGDISDRKWFYNSSGGSTGEPVRLIQDDIYLKWRNATNYYYYKDILSVDEPAAKKIVFWGSERDLFKGSIGIRAKISNWLSNTVFLNCFKTTDKDFYNFIQVINSYKPEIVRGYAGSLYDLCRYAEKNKIPLFSPKIVVSAAENLSDSMRYSIESNFQTKVYDFYGSREVSNLAGECRKGLLHPFLFWNYLEILDKDNQPVHEGEEGRVVVTNLFNYSMPLIRYEIGDMAIRGPEKCPCGNILPTLEKVTGRITDHFLLRNGRMVPAEFFIHLFGVVYNKQGTIIKFQVIQEDYSQIRIKIVSNNQLMDSYKSDIEKKINLVMGSDCRIIWEHVDDIPKTSSGKYLYTQSLVWKENDSLIQGNPVFLE